MGAMFARIVQWLSVASVGWFANDVSTPDITLDDTGNKVQRPFAYYLKWILTILAVGFIIYELYKWWKHRKDSKGGRNGRV